MSPFDCFKQMVCINLDKRTDRWQESKEEFKKMGIVVDRFSAIRHPHGATGCSLSHLAAIGLYQDLESLMIFEDDVCLKGDTSYLEAAYKSLPADWEVLYLGGIVFPDEINTMRVADHLHLARNIVCTHAIAYSRAGMERMIRQFSPQVRGGTRTPIDEYLRSVVQPSGKAYALTPLIFDQRPGYSDISKEHGGPHNLLLLTNNKFQ